MESRFAGDLFGRKGIQAGLAKALAERALSAETDELPTGERADPAGASEGQNQPPHRRNGSRRKTGTTDKGKVVVDITRDRNGSFDQVLIAKDQRRFPGFGTKIISIHAGE